MLNLVSTNNVAVSSSLDYKIIMFLTPIVRDE